MGAEKLLKRAANVFANITAKASTSTIAKSVWTKNDSLNFKATQSQGILVSVGYPDDRFEKQSQVRNISTYAGIFLDSLRQTSDRVSCTALGFNDERTLMNSRFYISIGTPLAPPKGQSVASCLEDCIALLLNLEQDFHVTMNVDPIRFAVGVSSGNILSMNYNGEVTTSGQPFKDATSLMYWTEDEPFVAVGSQITIDHATYVLLGKDDQSKYAPSIAPRGDRLAAIDGDIYVRTIAPL